MLKNIPPEVLFAEALRKVEQEENSPALGAWKKIVLEVGRFILHNGLDIELFKSCLYGPSCDGVD